MSKASWKSKKISPSVSVEETRGQVIRPVISRWLPNWVSSFREGSDDNNGVMCTANSTPVPLQKEPVQIEFAKCRGQIGQLRQQRVDIEARQARCADKLNTISDSVARAQAQREQALERLMLSNEPVPERDTTPLSMLQDSYLNFSVALKLLEQKQSKTLQNKLNLQAQQEKLTNDLQARKEALQQLQRTMDDHRVDEDSFKHAA